MKLYKELPKKGVVYDPCIFPWYRVELTPGQIVEQLAFLAFVLRDEEKITYAAGLLGDTSGGYGRRSTLVNLLLYKPENKKQRELLIGYMGSADAQTSSRAVEMVKGMTLEDEEYRLLEDMLRFKRSSLRGVLIGLLMGQKKPHMKMSLKRLLQDKKEEKRSAGLDILLRLSKEEREKDFFREVRDMSCLVEKPTDKERILIDEILGSEKETAEDKPGYGIYDPAVPETMLTAAEEEEYSPAALFRECMPLSEKEAVQKLRRLDQLFEEYKDYEYLSSDGQTTLLGNGYKPLKDAGEFWKKSLEERFVLKNYPLAEVFERFYREEILYRDLMGYPPVSHMMAVQIFSREEQGGRRLAESLAEAAKGAFGGREAPGAGSAQALSLGEADTSSSGPAMQLMGPAPASIGRINDIFRFVFYVKCPEYGKLIRIKDFLEGQAEANQSSDETVQFDFDPMNTL